MPSRSHVIRYAPRLGVALLLAAISGCRGDGGLFAFTKLPAPASENAVVLWAPQPTQPALALRLLEWCWDHRLADRYEELFTDDYAANCADPTEPPILQDDELGAARRLFFGARTIRFDYLGSLIAVPDDRPGKLEPWHKQVTVNTSLELRSNSNQVFAVNEAVRFYLVRGDSAAIPQALINRGFRPDPNRWYIERWQSLGPAPASNAPRPGVVQTSWCGIKRTPL